jgi:hypothetical protein
MNKIKLDLEAIDVQSFRTVEGTRLLPGTVHARSEDGTTDTEDEVCRYRPTPDYPVYTNPCGTGKCEVQSGIVYCPSGGFCPKW